MKLHNRNFVTETRRTKEKLTSAGVSGSHLRQISEVVALHFEVKYITLGVTGLCNEVLVQKTLKKAGIIQVIGKWTEFEAGKVNEVWAIYEAWMD